MGNGIVGIGIHLPPTFQASSELAVLSGADPSFFTDQGFLGRPVAETRSSVELGLIAANRALRSAQIEPGEVSILVSAVAAAPDYLAYSSAARMAHQLQLLPECMSIDVFIGCAGGPMAVKVGSDLLSQQQQGEYALIVTASRISDTVDLTKPEARSMFDIGDGAAAVVLKRNETSNRILAFAQHTDGSLAQEVTIPCGGSIMPPWMPRRSEDNYVTMTDRDRLAEIFKERYAATYASVIERSASSSGVSHHDLSMLCLNQLPAKVMAEIADCAGASYRRVVFEYPRTSHIGTCDNLIGLARALARGQLADNRGTVCLAGSGGGFHWTSLIVEFSDVPDQLRCEEVLPELQLESYLPSTPWLTKRSPTR